MEYSCDKKYEYSDKKREECNDETKNNNTLCVIDNKYNVCIKVIYFMFLFETSLTRFDKCMKIRLIRAQLHMIAEDRNTSDS